MKSILIIPSRLASTRLPLKPLHLMSGKPLISHVYERANQSFKGRIVVACCDERVQKLIQSVGGEAILTDANLPSGTDRIYDAYQKVGNGEDLIINLQGDMAIFPDDLIANTCAVFEQMECDVATAVCLLNGGYENPSNVKVAFDPCFVAKSDANNDSPVVFGRAHYFSRAAIPHNAAQYYKHIGLYIYTQDALQQFVKAPVSALENTEQLEQLRGLSIGLRFGAVVVNGDYFSVDTLDDVIAVENYIAAKLA